MAVVTIFTPTYNRKQLIERLYQSLLGQTCKEFEWLVIDDGSTDGTDEFFSQLTKQESPFSIFFIKQENGGKHRAINRGVQIATGELFFTVDSDDYLTVDAVEKVIKWKNSLDDSHKWAGVAGLRGDSKQNVIGERNNSFDYIDAKNTERRLFHLQGDKPEIYFTDVLKKFPFPEIPGENFISEEIVANTLARNDYYLRWFNEIIYIGDYLEGGLTYNDNKHAQNPQGCLLWAKGQLLSFPSDWRSRFLAIGIYHGAVKRKQTIRKTASDLNINVMTSILAYLIVSLYKPLFKLSSKKIGSLINNSFF